MASVAIRLATACHGQGFGTEALFAMTKFCFSNTELKRLWTKMEDEKNMKNVMDFLSAALPWIGMGLALAVFFALYAAKEKSKKNNDKK